MVLIYSVQRTGLADVGGFENRPPGTAADALLMYKIRTNAHRCLSCPNNCCYVAEDEVITSCPNIGKPPVVRRPYLLGHL